MSFLRRELEERACAVEKKKPRSPTESLREGEINCMQVL